MTEVSATLGEVMRDLERIVERLPVTPGGERELTASVLERLAAEIAEAAEALRNGEDPSSES